MTRKRSIGGVTERPDGRFWARLTVNGRRESLGIHDTRAAAEEAVQAMAAEKAAGGSLHRGRVFAEYGAHALDTREKAGYRAVHKDRSVWRAHIATSALADRPVKDVSTIEIGRFVKLLSKKKRKQGDRKLDRATVQKALTIVSGIFAMAIEDEIRPDNPCIGVRVKRGPATTDDDLDPKWDYLRPEEQHALATCPEIPLWGRLMMRVAWGTGLRLGELWNLPLRLVRADKDEKHPELEVRYGSRSGPPKNGRTRVIALFGDGLAAMREWLAYLPIYAPKNPAGLVFPTVTGCRRWPKAPSRHERVLVAEAGKGVRKTRVKYMFPEWLRAAGINRHMRWHDLRHTCASSLVSGFWGRKWTLEEVRDHMGHSSVTVTEIYAHLDRDARRETAHQTTGLRLSPGLRVSETEALY